MVEFPLQPGLTRALLKAAELGCEDLLLPVAAMLSVENIFIRPGQHCSEFKQQDGNIKYGSKLHLKVFDMNLSQLTPKWDIFCWRTSVYMKLNKNKTKTILTYMINCGEKSFLGTLKFYKFLKTIKFNGKCMAAFVWAQTSTNSRYFLVYKNNKTKFLIVSRCQFSTLPN